MSGIEKQNDRQYIVLQPRLRLDNKISNWNLASLNYLKQTY